MTSPHEGSAPGAVAGQQQVVLTVPAETAYASILRTTTAGLAARLDFTLDDIEDLRIAVDEACALLLPEATLGSSLRCRFGLEQDCLTVAVTVPSPEPRTPPQDGFAWTVLSALATTVVATSDDESVTITLARRRDGGE